MRTESVDREQLINEIWKNKGKVGLVSNAMGVSSVTIYNYANKYATVREAIASARLHFDEILVDTAEMKLQAAILAGQSWAVRYVLSSKGKDRGYGNKDQEAYGEGPIEIIWSEPASSDQDVP